MVELHQNYRGKDEDGGGYEEEDVAQVEKLLVARYTLLHHRQRGLVRPGLEQWHGDLLLVC